VSANSIDGSDRSGSVITYVAVTAINGLWLDNRASMPLTLIDVFGMKISSSQQADVG